MGQPASRFLTPGSSASSQPGNKRRRTGDYSHGNATEIYEDEEEVDEEVQAIDDDQEQEEQANSNDNDDEDRFTRFYDPQQNPQLRQQLRASIRSHHREIEGTLPLAPFWLHLPY